MDHSLVNMASTIDNESNEEIKLPADTLAILNEFLREKQERETTFQLSDCIAFDTLQEDWQMSQFWYDAITKQNLTKICLKLILSQTENGGTPNNVTIALLCCPSLYPTIRKSHTNGIVHLFEYDKRFGVGNADYIYFDYRQAATDDRYLDQFKNYFDIILMDPPYLSEECISNIAITVNKIKKPMAKIILCSGDVINDWAEQYLNVKKCAYQPQHERNLANEFCSYANFNLDELI